MSLFSDFYSNLKTTKLFSNCILCGGNANALQAEIESTNKEQNTLILPIICQLCHGRLPVTKESCFSCGLPMPKRDNSSHSNICGECLKNCPVFHRVVSAFHYEPPISDFITQLKFSAKFEVLPLLTDYLTKAINDQYTKESLPKAIIPVPLHPNKLSSRGFNQSNLLANRMSKQLKIPILIDGIRRCKETLPQSDLDLKERKPNMKRSFEISINCPEHVAIVDDVMTTGATVGELARQILKNGAKQVDTWCVARAYDL